MSVAVLRGRMTDATEFRRTAPEILDGRGARDVVKIDS